MLLSDAKVGGSIPLSPEHFLFVLSHSYLQKRVNSVLLWPFMRGLNVPCMTSRNQI